MSGQSNPDTININVKFGGRLIPITVRYDSTVKDLKSLLQQITDVLPRGQKLISRGKVLMDDSTIRESELANGVNVMLIASQGLHQGSGPVVKNAFTRVRTNSNAKPDAVRNESSFDKNRSRVWKVTGVVALSQSDLKAIPQEALDCGSSVRVLDIKSNFISGLPSTIGGLHSLQKLYLDANDLSNESVPWEALASLKQLSILSASHNKFTSISSGLGSLLSLKQLNISNNILTSLPADIGLLSQLEILNVSHNRISSLPESIGGCRALLEVDLSSNVLQFLPEKITQLANLRSLNLSNNGLKSVPGKLFQMCGNLSTINLHNTEITADVLRKCEGWEEFDKRRLSKHQKQLDFRVLESENFDEGADKR